MNQRMRGMAFACGTAVISGVAVFLNARGVRAVGDATVYTTAKNLVAAIVLVLLAAGLGSRAVAGPRVPRRWRPVIGLAVVGVVGGAVPFVLFFEGLARASSPDAAFVHKTLLIWVAFLALPLLGERLGGAHIAAIALLIAGQVVVDGGLADFRFGGGELLILGATLLWSAEVIVAKRLLADLAPLVLGVARMTLGAALLIGWVALSGRWTTLTELGAGGWLWAVATGVILAGYVTTWFTALSLAPAVDVTAVLSVGALITAALSAVDTGTLPSPSETIGLSMLLAGAAVIVSAAYRHRAVVVMDGR